MKVLACYRVSSLAAIIYGALGVIAHTMGVSRAEPEPTPTVPVEEVWWSLRPLVKPALPASSMPDFEDWPRTPLDRFILAKLKEKGLHPAPEADKRTLLRRLSFDLLGLPPTPEELATFLADQTPDAYEKQVDRLLASPHYGERQARHWMDLVHFAETHGHDQDRPRPNAWPYRDYLIRSFNADKPYARFVQEQLAGDVLFPGDSAGIVATGFLAAGPWDESSLLNIMEDTADKKIARLLDRDDMVTTTLSTFRQHDRPLRPLPRSQVRPDFAARLLRPASRVRRRGQGGATLRRRSRGRSEATGSVEGTSQARNPA